jgi:hypothetical protein
LSQDKEPTKKEGKAQSEPSTYESTPDMQKLVSNYTQSEVFAIKPKSDEPIPQKKTSYYVSYKLFPQTSQRHAKEERAARHYGYQLEVSNVQMDEKLKEFFNLDQYVTEDLTLEFTGEKKKVIVDGFARNWVKDLQNISVQDPLYFQKHRDIGNSLQIPFTPSALDFVKTASMYAKVIVKELYLPNECKTIAPIQVNFQEISNHVQAGGVAGGQKYVCGGIFFKVARDLYGLYDGDENAMKVAGHDLKGLENYFYSKVDGLNFPLVTKTFSKKFLILFTDVYCRLYGIQSPGYIRPPHRS